jgi:hypothetical protein
MALALPSFDHTVYVSVSGSDITGQGSFNGPYKTIAYAASTIVGATTASRYLIQVGPGTYTETSKIAMPSYVGLNGSGKGVTRIVNSTTDMFQCSTNQWYSNFLVEGSNIANSVFLGSDASRVHVRDVDFLNNGGANTQPFITQSGSTWATWFVEHCVIDSYRTSGYVMNFINTSGACRFVDVELNDVFCDTFHLTNFGGGALIRACQDIRFKDCKIRGGNNAGGSSSFQTGIRIELFSATGTAWMEVFTTYFNGIRGTTGEVAIYGTVGSDYLLANSYAPGAITDGTRTVSNSAVT